MREIKPLPPTANSTHTQMYPFMGWFLPAWDEGWGQSPAHRI
jgi:hypothetical protein